jgi:hypothetical protein
MVPLQSNTTGKNGPPSSSPITSDLSRLEEYGGAMFVREKVR